MLNASLFDYDPFFQYKSFISSWILLFLSSFKWILLLCRFYPAENLKTLRFLIKLNVRLKNMKLCYSFIIGFLLFPYNIKLTCSLESLFLCILHYNILQYFQISLHQKWINFYKIIFSTILLRLFSTFFNLFVLDVYSQISLHIILDVDLILAFLKMPETWRNADQVEIEFSIPSKEH